MAITITGFGGVEEIGGNAFVLDDGHSKLLLDFGKRFGSDKRVEQAGARPGWGDYFDEYLKPRTFRYIDDLRTMGLIPDLPGAYRADLGGRDGNSSIDGVIVSHAHMDHAGLIGLLRPDIPIITSGLSRATLDSVQATGISAPESDFVRTKAKGKAGRRKDGGLTVDPRFDEGPRRTFATAESLQLGNWRIENHGVDHSIHGARASIVTGQGISLAYTGDFRMHGRQRHLSESFIAKAGGVDVLVSEGTNVHGPHDNDRAHKQTDDERSVEAQIDEAIAHEDARTGRTGFVGISYPPRDLDRFQSILAVAARRGRRLVISPKQAHLLESLRAAGRDELPDPMADLRLAVHFEAAGKGLILRETESRLAVARADLGVDEVSVGREDFLRLLEGDYTAWAVKYLHAPTRVSARDISGDPRGFLFSISFWSITELLDIWPDPEHANGLYIHSQTQPFNDDMVMGSRKLDRWLLRFKLDRVNTHVSGHLGQVDLDWVLDEIRPRTLIPIHTQAAAVTASAYRARSGNEARLPVWGVPLQLA